MPNSVKIGFLIVGTQKAGTTALDQYLRAHPDIAMARKKEVHFFNNDTRFSDDSAPDYSAYEAHFDFGSEAKIYGECTPVYMYWPQVCERIASYNLQMKLIFILRNPADRAYAQWAMQVERGIEKSTFSECIRQEEERLKGANAKSRRQFSYVDRGFYAAQVETYQKTFPAEQMLFLKYETFRAYQEATLDSIFKFLDLDAINYPFQKNTLHRSIYNSPMPEGDRTYLIEKYRADISQLEQKVNLDCSDWLS